ncbi:MAG: hypothetical protein KatS3mg115_1034 [Candidatus Poribacteria bacterium]|nr:MAG: hypothetical protein KatS3mg115_1034 [Candidatus Poribacteria bacterium]
MAPRIEFPSPLPRVLREQRRVFRPVRQETPKLEPNLKLRRNPEVERSRRLLTGSERPSIAQGVQPSPRELIETLKAAPERSLRAASQGGNLERMMSLAKSVNADLAAERKRQLLTGQHLRNS